MFFIGEGQHMNRFLRTEALIGATGLKKLQNAHVTVVGIGGVGGAALEGLVRAGVGRITVIDGDTVSITNCNRQLLATAQTVGSPKTEAAKTRMLQINPDLQFEAVNAMLNQENACKILPQKTDFIADCIDDVPAKLLLAEHCRQNQIPLIMCMGTGNRLSSNGLQTANFDKTAGCPLAKKMRLLLKNAGFKKVRALYSADPVTPAFPVEDGGKRTVGSISYVPTIAGMKLAEHIINRILNQEITLDIPK